LLHRTDRAKSKLWRVLKSSCLSSTKTSGECISIKPNPTLADFIASSTKSKRFKNVQMNESVKSLSDFNLKVYVETYGCQMNVSDTEIVLSILKSAGHEHISTITDADVIITNTCAVRENAEDKVHNRLKYFHSLRKRNKTKGSKSYFPLVGVLGCMAERLKDKLLAEESVDFVCGPDAYRDLPRLLDSIISSIGSSDTDTYKAANTLLSMEETYADIRPVRLDNNSNAYVSIMRGCNNMCSFCIVPFTRGRERSRPFQSIIDEITALRNPINGNNLVREVTLLGQNVNGYHDISAESAAMFPTSVYKATVGFENLFKSKRRDLPGARFPDLLRAVADIDPELRIRFTSPHPKDFPDEVLDLIAERPNLCASLHLPVQSGSSSVLKRMRRGYTREIYLDLIDRVRQKIPEVTISTDVITGFCDETEQEHEDTLSLMQQVGFDQAFMFAYSLRDKTHAAHSELMRDSVDEATKQRRLKEIIEMFRSRLREKNQLQESGALRLVLLEGPSTRSGSVLTGRTDGNKRVLFPAAAVLTSLDRLDKKDLRPSDERVSCDSGDDLAMWLERGREDESALRKVLFSPFESIPTEVKTSLLSEGLTALLDSHPHAIALGAENTGQYVVVRILKADGPTLRGVALSLSSIAEFNRFLQTFPAAKL